MKHLVIALMLSIPMAAGAADIDTTPAANQQNSDFVNGKKAIEAKNWQAAVDAFTRAARSEPRNADIQNYLGYSYRHMDKMDLSFKHYNEALRLEPNHRGAHEYIGWAYLKTGKLAEAEQHLARLESICGKGCDEYQKLSKGVTDYKTKNKS